MSPPPPDSSLCAELPAVVAPVASAFGLFYAETLSPLRNYLSRMLGCRHEAQDIAHDAYLKAYLAMQRYPVEKPDAFLFTVARRLALNHRNRRTVRYVPTDSEELESRAGSDSDTAQEVINRQEHRLFDQAIRELPAGCQQVLVLRVKEGFSHAEIAEHLHIAPSTVAKQLARASRLLKANIVSDAPSKNERG